MVAAMGCWAGNDVFVKLCAERVAAGPILAVRGAFACAMMLAIVLVGRHWRDWRALLRPLVALRCALEFGAALTSVWALSLAALATVTAITMLAPLLATAGAIALRWEQRDPTRSSALTVGFAGALLVVAPWEIQQPSPAGIASAIVCALFLALRDLASRKLAQAVSAPLLTGVTTATACLAGLALWASGDPSSAPLEAASIGLLALAAIGACIGNLLLLHALRLSDVGLVMPFRFTLLLWAAVLGGLVWDERPAPSAWLGMALIALGGTLCLRRSASSA
jgi:drug/metabolite transporter (DMT)-like permease